MCAICGYLGPVKPDGKGGDPLEAMLEVLKHRGPDETGFYRKPGIGLAHARLSIVGIGNGRQPISNEDESVWLVYAGEIFNHEELRKGLEGKGHRLRTDSDGEVIVHLYEESGMKFLERLNGQFAFALWDEKKRELFLCRDRLGILPLFYHDRDGAFVFGSEMKGILAFPGVEARLDPEALDQVFTFWSTAPPKTMLEGIFQVRPGHYLRVRTGGFEEIPYWQMNFPADGDYPQKSEERVLDELQNLLSDAVDIRLKADVPVGVYLSGGLDSSAVAGIAAHLGGRRIETFSVRFEDGNFDEGKYQELVSTTLGLHHSHTLFSEGHLADILPKSIYHAESAVLRLAMAPLLVLSGLVRARKFKAVVGGEGADEILLGYDIFKEVKIRRFWAKQPQSESRPFLLNRLYPYLPVIQAGGDGFLKSFFSRGLADTSDIYYSHRLRWESAARAKRFFSDSLREELGRYDAAEDLKRFLPVSFSRWDPMARAQHLECALFLSNYLLSSQGDRMAMANSVEVRYPYLDHRIVEFCNQIPPHVKMRGLREKSLLKKSVSHLVPRKILDRPKLPYRAPGGLFQCLRDPANRLNDFLSERSIKESGYFNPEIVGLLLKKLRRKDAALSEADQMALSGVLTSQLFHDLFIKKGAAAVV